MPNEKIYFEDSSFRVQSSFVSALMPMQLNVYEKKGLFESVIIKSHHSLDDLKEVSLTSTKDSVYIILIDSLAENGNKTFHISGKRKFGGEN